MSPTGPDRLFIDGSHGEGGGQILRTAVSLSAATGRPIRIEKIRAGRAKPGLAAQHLTAIRAAATIVGADVTGDTLGSATLEFQPGGAPVAGTYRVDVAEAREGGSAGAASLVLQTVALPLALAEGESTVTVMGGTHVPWSPPYDFLQDVWLATLRRLGLNASARLDAWGFYPAGDGEITLQIAGAPSGSAALLEPLPATDRGRLTGISGRAVAANLPSHIAQRMADRAEALLRPLGVPVRINTERVRAVSPGAWIFLKPDYEAGCAGFGGHGRRGKPAEEVAEDAVAELMAHHQSGAVLDRHLSDQILLPLAFADGPSEFTSAAVTRHLETNAWAIGQFGIAKIDIERAPDGTGHVMIFPLR